MKTIFLYIMSLLYTAAGIYHFVNPKMYLRIMPPYIPFHLPMVYITGVMEIAFALLLFPESTRPYGAWLIIFLLIVIFPANIQMAINFYQKQHPGLWIAIVRLPLQIVLIWWASRYI